MFGVWLLPPFSFPTDSSYFYLWGIGSQDYDEIEQDTSCEVVSACLIEKSEIRNAQKSETS